MHKRLIPLAGFLLALTFILSGCNSASGAYSAKVASHSLNSDSWTWSANSINGCQTANVNLSTDDLTAFHVKNASRGGSVSLTITQGEVQQTLDISGSYDAAVDMSDFEAGKLNLRLDFKNTEDLDLAINW